MLGRLLSEELNVFASFSLPVQFATFVCEQLAIRFFTFTSE